MQPHQSQPPNRAQLPYKPNDFNPSKPLTITRQTLQESSFPKKPEDQRQTVTFLMEKDKIPHTKTRKRLEKDKNEAIFFQTPKLTSEQTENFIIVNNDCWDALKQENIPSYTKRFINRTHKPMLRFCVSGQKIDRTAEKYIYQELWMMIYFLCQRFEVTELEMAHVVFLNENYHLEKVLPMDLEWTNIPLLVGNRAKFLQGIYGEHLQFSFIH
jgi:hypothetical protein